MKKTQQKQVIAFMRRRGSITAMDAVRFGCLRLAARISDMKADGYRVISKLETKKGKTYARYTLA